MPKLSIDEIIAKRRLSADDNGNLYKAVILDEPAVKGYDASKRSQRFVMSSESKDLYGDIVRQGGLDIESFMKNPVALAYHMHSAPIGTWSDLAKVGGKSKRTEGTVTLFAEGTTERSDEIGRLLAAGGLRACSIGFMPSEAEWILDEQGRNTYGIEFLASTLLECSICSVPANPDALGKAAAGDMRLAVELFEGFLDTYCERTTGGLIVKKPFEDAYFELKAPKTVSLPPEPEAVTVEQVESMFSKFTETVKAMLGIVDKTPETVTEKSDPVIEPEVTVSEPESAPPVLIKGSRAKANAKTAKLRASLRAKGLLN
jgi:HK97 family phage prohead protease